MPRSQMYSKAQTEIIADLRHTARIVGERPSDAMGLRRDETERVRAPAG